MGPTGNHTVGITTINSTTALVTFTAPAGTGLTYTIKGVAK